MLSWCASFLFQNSLSPSRVRHAPKTVTRRIEDDFNFFLFFFPFFFLPRDRVHSSCTATLWCDVVP